ncbi:3'-5' exonuclease domain-containing protein [Heracleum sosnowskyi]|uniref:3'-5' exonuclease domain-containing protein n=1 Tax=Heracleum sosnowskyi TaxID=360622 RepID=A0AAD8GU45_9APIA|nr:3'-5' exonuclease domain-containing protein [Heracleum sosnowskyi]
MSGKYYVNFQGNLIETIVTNKASDVDEWLHNIQLAYHGKSSVVGLDCEWRPHIIRSMSNKTATLQLCIDTKCLIVQMFYLDYIPQSLKDFFTDPKFTFVGVEVQDDALKLQDEYGLRVSSTADIQALAMTRWPLRFVRKPGLKGLARGVAELNMEKPKHVSMSNWEAVNLNLQQIEYACIDAFASYKIGHKLLEEI